MHIKCVQTCGVPPDPTELAWLIACMRACMRADVSCSLQLDLQTGSRRCHHDPSGSLPWSRGPSTTAADTGGAPVLFVEPTTIPYIYLPPCALVRRVTSHWPMQTPSGERERGCCVSGEGVRRELRRCAVRLFVGLVRLSSEACSVSAWGLWGDLCHDPGGAVRPNSVRA